jgi:hypothetical protein
MFSHPHVRSALLSSLVTLLLPLMIAGFPGASVGQATTLSSPAAAGPVITLDCPQTPTFPSVTFPDPPKVDNIWYPLVPGTQFILEGHSNRTGEVLPHEIRFTVTDLTKMVNGVKTWVLWDLDINNNVLLEAELAFQAQDNVGNVWVLGEYPEEYKGGQKSAPSTWISGKNGALAGVLVPGAPVVSATTKFLEAYAPNGVIYDCGRVAALGPRDPAMCVPAGCYGTDVLEIDEDDPSDPAGGVQLKYYAPGAGNFQIGALNDPEGETQALASVVQLSLEDCLKARQAAKDLDASGRAISSLYAQTADLVVEPTKSCESIAPPATPTPPISPTPTPPGTPQSVYLPMISHALAPIPPEFYDGCKSDPNPAAASNYPVRIVGVDKIAEKVTLENVSNATVLLEDWNLCSINGNQDHDQIGGAIAPHAMRTFPNTGTPGIWNDTQRDDAALYNAVGELVSYWVDQ